MTLDPRERFSKTVDLYTRYRPGYPTDLGRWLFGLGNGREVADIGCGTGISSRFLAGAGFSVIGVDPNEDMLAQARAAGGPRYVRGESTATTLDGESVDLVTAAQAFHWFDIPATMRELQRILRRDGWAAAFWNVRTGPLNDAYEELLRRHVPEYRELAHAPETLAKLRATDGVHDLREAEFANAQRLDRDGFVGRVGSSSYVAHAPDRAALERAAGELFDRHAREGAVDLPYRTVVLAWRLR